MAGEALLNSFAYACLAGASAHLGRADEAGNALESFVRERTKEFDSRGMLVPERTVAALIGGYLKVWRNDEDRQLIANGLRKAGLPG